LKRKKEKESNPNLDHSLSLDQISKELVKQINLVPPYLSRKFQEIILTKFDMVSNSIFSKYAKYIYMAYSFPFSKMH
jgi:hypothetical protein